MEPGGGRRMEPSFEVLRYRGADWRVDDPAEAPAPLILTRYGAFPNTLAGLAVALELHRQATS